MIQPLRKTHRGIFLVLAVLLPVLFLSGLAFRHSWPRINTSKVLPTTARRCVINTKPSAGTGKIVFTT